MTVVAVEYRTGSRFDAGPLEQITDATTALGWVSRNASQYGIDPQRIGVAGFSSGSTLALLLGTRGVEQPMAAPRSPAERVYPAAVMVTGACPNPSGSREDGYFRKMIARKGIPSDYSPMALIARGQPPMLVIQATGDEYCAYEDARAFVERYVAAGNVAELATVEGAGHFFGFYYPPGQRQMREAIANALRGWGWTTP
ncbi:MAG: alpha/beta hydrolase [Acidobacteriota bacterium]|nr:alpha/beta hydrolase [Acidobacteriota bacterium]